MSNRVGFGVIYRWKLKPGLEEQFRHGWEATTQLLMSTRGALGSRLHRAEDGTWIAYAQWPSKAAWEEHRRLGPADPEASRLMLEAEAEADAPILLTPIADYLGAGRPS